jgi:hypothetical protein
MQPPVRPILRDGLRAVAQKRIPEVLAASLSLVVVIASHRAKPAPKDASSPPQPTEAASASAATSAAPDAAGHASDGFGQERKRAKEETSH